MKWVHRNVEYVQYIKYCLYIYICSAFVGLDNKLYKMHGTYIEIVQSFFKSRVLVHVGGCIHRHLVLHIRNTEVLLLGLYHHIVARISDTTY